MHQVDAYVLEVEAEGNGPFVRVIFGTSEIAQQMSAGRFVLADLGCFLREALFPAWISPKTFEVLVSRSHPGAALRRDATVNMIGPVGRGFQVPGTARRLLLVASGELLPALLPLAIGEPGHARSVALLMAAPSAADPYPFRLLPPTMEVHLVTADGTATCAGSTRNLFPDLARWADHICVADDPYSYPVLAEIVRETRVAPTPGFAEALVVPPMACGVGACRGCAVSTCHGLRLACTDGPVFDLLEVG